jgi:hypothetical protein
MITITEASGTVGILNLLGHEGYWYGREKKSICNLSIFIFKRLVCIYCWFLRCQNEQLWHYFLLFTEI